MKFLQKMIKKYAILTDLWKEISTEIDYVISEMDLLLKKLSPSRDDLKKASEKQKEHFRQVNNVYPNLEH